MGKKKNTGNQEIEVRFLNVDYDKVVATLKQLGAKDHGEDFLREVIFADQDLS